MYASGAVFAGRRTVRRALILITLAAGVMLLAGVANATLPPGGTFTDDNGNVHEPSIEAIAAAGITRGCNPPLNTAYCPDAPVTRGQMAAFLSRALDLPVSSTDFFDDDGGSAFEPDINALAAAGITLGCNPPENTKYCPEASVTRGQMAAFLDRAFGFADSSVNYFGDDDASVFEPNINDIAEAGVTQGCDVSDEDRYCPGDSVSRAQMASFLVRGLGLDPIVPPPADPVPPGISDEDWLQALNRYRAWSGLDAVAEDTALSDGVAAHVRYLGLTPDEYFTGTYANWHEENPASPYYTSAGAQAGTRSNLAYAATDVGAIESWIAAPFHSVGLMEPGLRTAGFARGSIDAPRLNAGLDVISGIDEQPAQQVLFPGPDSRMTLNRFTGELPDPTEPCTYNTDSTWGLPIYALLTFEPAAETTARLTYPDGSTVVGTGAASRLCVLTEHNAFSTDPTYAYAMGTYRDRNMVLLFPDDPLEPGAYSVEIETSGQIRAWSFEVVDGS